MTSQLLLELEPPPAPTLANFLAGANRAAVEALGRLAATPGTVYLWGEAGTGKSHLLTAVAHGADVATIDDVDRLAEAGQLEAFDRFNRVRAAGGSVVAAGTAPPARLVALREDLRSRVLSGLVFQLVPLTDREKAVALAAHAAERGMRLPPEAIDHLLERLPRDLGTQFAVLDAIDRYSLALKRPVTLPLVRAALGALGLA
ncbi:MAG: HdaA/DnaA family protein [Bacteroidota bacterium]